jgi:gamma-glutamyl:cysteine ligase YbdK (ATP-grasp superfamily)
MELDNHFRACKSGLGARIITSVSGDTEPMMQVVETLFDLARSQCETLGDCELLAGLERSLTSRNGAELQRSAWLQQHSCMAVTRFLVESLHHPASLRASA